MNLEANLFVLIVGQLHVLVNHDIGYFSTINRNIETQAIVMFINTTPGFPHFYYILGANLGSLLNGDVSVMRCPSLCLKFPLVPFVV